MAILHALLLAPALAAVVLALIGFAGAAFSHERDAEPRPTRETVLDCARSLIAHGAV